MAESGMFRAYGNEDFQDIDMSSSRCGTMTDVATVKVTLKANLKERIESIEDVESDQYYGKNGKYVYLLELGLQALGRQ